MTPEPQRWVVSSILIHVQRVQMVTIGRREMMNPYGATTQPEKTTQQVWQKYSCSLEQVSIACKDQTVS
ncbi:MAG: hypothetical protein CBD65_02310 [Synechococcus sp. TMED205]|nr:MAG: hypothetical protein CBD65_02310 [Synechococcus sp. TMED205]